MAPYRIEWLDEAKEDVRALDQNVMRTFGMRHRSQAYK
jgi:hypothetical protein